MSEVVTLEVPLLQVQVFVVSTTLTLGYPFLYQVGAKCIWEISTLGVCWLYVKWSVGTAYYCLLVSVWALCWKWKDCHLTIYVLVVVSPGNSSVDEGTPKACRCWNCFSKFPLHVRILNPAVMGRAQHSCFPVFFSLACTFPYSRKWRQLKILLLASLCAGRKSAYVICSRLLRLLVNSQHCELLMHSKKNISWYEPKYQFQNVKDMNDRNLAEVEN